MRKRKSTPAFSTRKIGTGAGTSPQVRLRKPARDNVVNLSRVRLIREPEGGWLVITPKGYGWAHGDLQAALEEMRWLDRNLRGRS
jgi:hypothetical protein